MNGRLCILIAILAVKCCITKAETQFGRQDNGIFGQMMNMIDTNKIDNSRMLQLFNMAKGYFSNMANNGTKYGHSVVKTLNMAAPGVYFLANLAMLKDTNDPDTELARQALLNIAAVMRGSFCFVDIVDVLIPNVYTLVTHMSGSLWDTLMPLLKMAQNLGASHPS